MTNVTDRKRRDRRALEKRRRRAARLFKANKKQAEVAKLLEVSRQSVSRWYEAWERGGASALKGAGRLGRPPRLNRQQLKDVEQALLAGARPHGYTSALWTLKRIAGVIEKLTGVHYHPGHVWRILGQMGWSLQRPGKKARERNEEAVKNWLRKKWPKIKKKPKKLGPG